MAGSLLWLLMGVVLVGAVVVFARFRLANGISADVIPSARATPVWLWRWTGITVGVVAAYLLAAEGSLGRGLLLAAPLFSFCALLGVLAGEFFPDARNGTTREAMLEVRRVHDYLPKRLSRAVGAAGCVLFGLLALTTAMASPDDQGRAGRSLSRTCDAIFSEGSGPWVGSFYSVPLAIIVAVGLVLAGVVLRRILLRARPQDLVGRLGEDNFMRRRAASAVTGACGVLIALPLLGVASLTAAGLLRSSCPPPWWSLTGGVLIASIPMWLALLVFSVTAIVPIRR